MANSKIATALTCEQCVGPIILDDSHNYLGELILSELSLIAVPLISNLELETDSGPNGFMVVLNNHGAEFLGMEILGKADLYDKIHYNNDLDHPLCDECTHTLSELMENQLKLTQAEYYDYNEYLFKLESEENESNLSCLEKELDNLINEEQRLMGELINLQQENNVIQLSIDKHEKEYERFCKKEERYLKQCMKKTHESILLDNENNSLELQLANTQMQLDKLSNTNVLTSTFHIWHSGDFGIINNFRLGRSLTVHVEWSEINAAWGQTALLLTALARKINLTFQNYRLMPCGNHSYVQDLREHCNLPLFGVGGVCTLWSAKFSSAMVAFLDCLQQFNKEVERYDPGFCLPYRMNKGKIEDSATGTLYSIKIQFNSEEQWTKALKFLLTNLKWGLTWLTLQFQADNSEDDATNR